MLNQLIFEEYIANLLYGELKYWQENKDKLGMKYPIERAEEMARRMHELGKLADGTSILDKMRQIITHIGNALGYSGFNCP